MMDPFDLADDAYERHRDERLDDSRGLSAGLDTRKHGELDLSLPFIPFVFPI